MSEEEKKTKSKLKLRNWQVQVGSYAMYGPSAFIDKTKEEIEDIKKSLSAPCWHRDMSMRVKLPRGSGHTFIASVMSIWFREKKKRCIIVVPDTYSTQIFPDSKAEFIIEPKWREGKADYDDMVREADLIVMDGASIVGNDLKDRIQRLTKCRYIELG